MLTVMKNHSSYFTLTVMTQELNIHYRQILEHETRSKDLKTQKMQGCILKAVGAISKVTNALLELKNNKNLNTTTLSTMVHDCTDSIVLLSHVTTMTLSKVGMMILHTV